MNICTLTDSYKLGHWQQYPKGTTKVYSYLEARNGARYDETVFFGLQPLLRQLAGSVVNSMDVRKAQVLADAHFGNANIFGQERWWHILHEHSGVLPLEIKAVPEGTPVSNGNVLMTVENTDPKCYWLTNHIESFLTHVWYPSTVASLSRQVKKICEGYLDTTSVRDGRTKRHLGLDFMLHDFGFRGVSSTESGRIGGAAHLVNFLGTDTVPAIEFIQDEYGCGSMPAFSVPATEHSVMTAKGEEGEMDVVGQVLDAYPTGIVSIVIDSYNYQNFIHKVWQRFHQKILAREGKVVFRPDSGNPVDVTLDVLSRLQTCFGNSINTKGYKVLNPKVGCIWGDGIDLNGIAEILDAITRAGWSAENMVFGMGGGLLQKVNRDTQRFAFKSSYQEVHGVGRDIFKEPLDKSKTSKRGRLKLCKDGLGFITTQEGENNHPDNLQTVFKNGKIIKHYSWEEVRANAV